MESFGQKYTSEIALVNSYLEDIIPAEKEIEGLKVLTGSMRYSLNNPGKRFRALLSLLTARSLGFELNLVLPYAAAVELVHTYSLVHDDLPSMDNDDFRRGQPSNHKVYGEAMAIIAGDALVTKAFEMIADNYEQMPKLGLRAVKILSEASGFQGMIGGQAMDIIATENGSINIHQIQKLHEMKTGALIRAATEGAALLCDAGDDNIENFSQFGNLLGLAFQVADDILDHREDGPEVQSYPSNFGLEESKDMLKQLTLGAFECLKPYGDTAQGLREITQFNLSRVSE